MLTPFPMMDAGWRAASRSGLHARGISAPEWLVLTIPAILVSLRYPGLFGEHMFAAWIVDYLFAYALRIVFQYPITIATMRGLSLERGRFRGESGYAVAHGVGRSGSASHGDRQFLIFAAASERRCARIRRILVYDADPMIYGFCDLLPGELVSAAARLKEECSL